MSVSGFHRSDLAETKFETRIPLFACRFRGPRLFLRQFACDVCAAMLCRVSGIVSGCVLNRVSCAGFCCVSRRTLKGWLVWGGRCGGGSGEQIGKCAAGPGICLFQAPGPFRVEGPSRTRSCVSSQVKAGFGLESPGSGFFVRSQ